MLTKAITVLSLSGNVDMLDGMSHARQLEKQEAECSPLGYPLAIPKLQRRSFLSSLGIHIAVIALLGTVHPSGYVSGKPEALRRPAVVTPLYFKSKPTSRVLTDNVSARLLHSVNSPQLSSKPRLFAAMPSIDATPKESPEAPAQPHLDTFPGPALVEPASVVTTTPRLSVPAGFTDVGQPGSRAGVSGRHVMLGSFSTAHGSLSSTNMSARSGDEVRLAGFPSARTPPLQISNRWSVSSSGPTFEKVKIIDMPKPEYTELARSLGIRGVVRVAVVFKADGSVLLTGITHSLGFGLDESAAAAVMHITFQPARRDGKENVDQPAVVEAVFQLSNRALKADEIK